MAALMGSRSIFVLTHDSIAIGEDGPTHQPIEQTMSLRLIPGLSVFRPADALETAAAWQAACHNENKPTALLLSRQKLPVLHAYKEVIHDGAARGAYVLNAGMPGKVVKAVFWQGQRGAFGTCRTEALAKEKINVSVVSMPSWDVFEMQDDGYKESVLTKCKVKIAIEAGVPLGWSRYTGTEANVIGIDKFGASAPGDVVYAEYGFNVDNVTNRVKKRASANSGKRAGTSCKQPVPACTTGGERNETLTDNSRLGFKRRSRHTGGSQDLFRPRNLRDERHHGRYRPEYLRRDHGPEH
jgi:transketolase